MLLSLWNWVRGVVFVSTYNPEAETALQAQKNAAQRVRQTFLDEIASNKSTKDDAVSRNEWRVGATPAFDAEQTSANNWLQQNLAAMKDDLQNRLDIYTSAMETIFTYNTNLRSLANIVVVARSKVDGLQTDVLKNKVRQYLTELETYVNAKDTRPTATPPFDEVSQRLITTEAKINADFSATDAQAILKPVSALEIKDLKEKEEAAAAGPQDRFVLSRFFKDFWQVIVGYFAVSIYVALALLGGMLAANDMIGRSPMYRVLYFIYGFIFGPIVCGYYLFRKIRTGKRPKIYTLLPLTTMQVKDPLTWFFTFPFRYLDDGAACQAVQDFLTESAKQVGQSYQAKPCPKDPSPLDIALANLQALRPKAGTGTSV